MLPAIGRKTWHCELRSEDTLMLLYKDWGKDYRLTFRTEDTRGATRIILDIDQVIEVRNALNELLEGL